MLCFPLFSRSWSYFNMGIKNLSLEIEKAITLAKANCLTPFSQNVIWCFGKVY